MALRDFSIFDILKFNNINLDYFTETYNMLFYAKYLAKWPEYCKVMEAPNGRMMGYIIGKVEGDRFNNEKKNWHGHVTAVTVAPEYRRQGLARLLMDYLEEITERFNGWYVDLFVRKSNDVAIKMYQNLGYVIYQVVQEYYSGEVPEDGLDMRKPMSRDTQKVTCIPRDKPIKSYDLEFL